MNAQPSSWIAWSAAMLCVHCGPSERLLDRAEAQGCEAGIRDGTVDGNQDGDNCAEYNDMGPSFPAEEPDDCSEIDLSNDSSDPCSDHWYSGYRDCYSMAYAYAYHHAAGYPFPCDTGA